MKAIGYYKHRHTYTHTHTHTHTHTLTHTNKPNTQRKITMERVSMKIKQPNQPTPFFKTTPPTLPTVLFLWGKPDHPFFQKCRKLKFDAFDLQLKFNLKYTNFALQEN